MSIFYYLAFEKLKLLFIMFIMILASKYSNMKTWLTEAHKHKSIIYKKKPRRLIFLLPEQMI